MPGRRALILLGVLGGLALCGPWLAPYDPGATQRGYGHAPPMWPQLRDGLAIHPVVLVDRLQERFRVDRTRTVPWPWAPGEEPVFLLGADRSGRDVLSRVLSGSRVSLGLGLLAVIGAAALGTLLGSIAGARGGLVDDLLMRLADFVAVLPVLYVIVVLRAALPLVVPPATVFGLTLAIFVLVGWPVVARGIRWPRNAAASTCSPRARPGAHRATCCGAISCPHAPATWRCRRACCCPDSFSRRQRSHISGSVSRTPSRPGGRCCTKPPT
jgi:ABC-type dipeptide/oligopeptide/nickel transport system permease subunit